MRTSERREERRRRNGAVDKALRTNKPLNLASFALLLRLLTKAVAHGAAMLRRRTVAQGATCVALALAILSMSSVNEFDGFTWDMIALTASVILDTWDILFLHLLCIFTDCEDWPWDIR
eukprot:g12298.t1